MNWLNTSARWPSRGELLRGGPRARRPWPSRRRRTPRRPGPASRLSCRSRVSDRKIASRCSVEVVEEAEHGLPLALEVGLVDRAVPRGQHHLEDLLLLGRQVARDVLLGAAQQERPDPPAEPRRAPPRSPSRSTGLATVSGEALRPRVEPGRHDRQQRPQLHQPVLHRRAGQRQPERYVEPPHGLVGLALVVLDGLRLVEDQAAPGPGDVLVGLLEPEQRVGGDHHVGALAERRRATARAGPGTRVTTRTSRPGVKRGGLARPGRRRRWSARPPGTAPAPCARACATSARVCSVLPSPMSSARIPPSPDCHR